ncbi:MAG: hypothetical protein QGG63_03215, partial [Candidatus Pacebacteria bacterium]|nr:hypothetical protein [Candidatus Paceibacterota bacterium]
MTKGYFLKAHFCNVKRIVTGCLILASLILPSLTNAEEASNKKITRIAGDLYRFQNKFHYSVFLVTPQGIIVTDPITSNAAKWLKAELAKRFKQPVK